MKLGSSIRRRRELGAWHSAWKRLVPKKLRRGSGKRGDRWFFSLSPRMLWSIGILAVVGFGGGYLFTTRVVYPLPPPPGDLFPVPELAGELPEDAVDTLAAVDLILGSVDSMNHPTIPAGRIVGQSPLPGQLSLAGNTVRIAVSIGPEQRPVPDVLRLHANWAQTILETSGFLVSVDSVDSDRPRGTVVDIDPEPGTEATIPMEVRLAVSTGPPEFEMPLLLGLSEEEALSVLDSLGLKIDEVETRFRFGRDQGLIVEQEPPAATMVQEGATVRLVVGRRGQ